MDMELPDGDLSPEQAAAFLDEFMQDADDAQDVQDDVQKQEFEKQPETPPVDEVAALRAEIEALKTANQSSTATEQQAAVDTMPESVQALAEKSGLSDDELAALFGDFSEKDIAKAVQKLVAMSVSDEVGKALMPIHEKEAQAAQQAHYQAILAAHPDAGELADSKELESWVNGLPKYAQAGVREVLEKGSAFDVIEVLNDFKAATGKNTQSVQKQPEKRAKVPDTLGQIPAGRAPNSGHDALNDLPPDQLAEKLAEMSPEQVERFLNGN